MKGAADTQAARDEYEALTMDKHLLEQLQAVTQEEQAYLDGAGQVKKDIYTSEGESAFVQKNAAQISDKTDAAGQNRRFEIDAGLFLQRGKLVTVRHHSRFVEFPVHKHNYIEIVYVEHSVKRAEFHDVGINFIALPEFFDIPLHMVKQQNVIADFLAGTLRQKNVLPQYLMFRLKSEK